MAFEDRLMEALGLEKEASKITRNRPFAAPQAPPKPTPTKPTPTKSPTPSKPRPKDDPFRVPRPAKLPQPKNCYENRAEHLALLIEAYEDEVHQSTRDFWASLPKNKRHILGTHPLFALYGEKLAKQGYSHVSDRAIRALANDQRQFMQIFQRIMQLEHNHKEELEDLAVRITAKIWGIDPDRLRPELGQPEHGEETDDLDITPEKKEKIKGLEPEIHKRLSMNSLTHGAAIHQMMTMHHMIDKEINAISPELLKLYDKISAASFQQYWLIDVAQMLAMMGQFAAGSTKVEWPEDDEETEENESEGPVVVARAVCFPVLCQELSKGVMEMLAAHGLQQKSAEELEQIMNQADDVRHEIWLSQVGPELWRNFIKVVPKGVTLAGVVAELASLPPKQVNEILTFAVENPKRAAELLRELLEEGDVDVEEFEEKQEESEEDDSDWWKKS